MKTYVMKILSGIAAVSLMICAVSECMAEGRVYAAFSGQNAVCLPSPRTSGPGAAGSGYKAEDHRRYSASERNTAVSQRFSRSKAGHRPARFRVTSADVNRYFSHSAFMGNSVSLGLAGFFASKPRGYLGSPKVICRGSYSFRNDFNSNRPYMLQYRGVTMHAQDAVRASRVSAVFIMMGTNDQYGSVSDVFADYKRYLQSIRKKNPKVVIYVEAMTPCLRQTANISNSRVHGLNSLLEKYVSQMKDMYYIDINSPLSDRNGRLVSGYSSDGFVHISHAGYQVWTDTVAKFVRSNLQKYADTRYRIAVAKKAVNQKKLKLSRKRYRTALHEFNLLKNSSEKDDLKREIIRLKARIRRLKKAEHRRRERDKKDKAGKIVTPSPSAAPVKTQEENETGQTQTVSQIQGNDVSYTAAPPQESSVPGTELPPQESSAAQTAEPVLESSVPDTLPPARESAVP